LGKKRSIPSKKKVKTMGTSIVQSLSLPDYPRLSIYCSFLVLILKLPYFSIVTIMDRVGFAAKMTWNYKVY